jgi:hypothetical protein
MQRYCRVRNNTVRQSTIAETKLTETNSKQVLVCSRHIHKDPAALKEIRDRSPMCRSAIIRSFMAIWTLGRKELPNCGQRNGSNGYTYRPPAGSCKANIRVCIGSIFRDHFAGSLSHYWWTMTNDVHRLCQQI